MSNIADYMGLCKLAADSGSIKPVDMLTAANLYRQWCDVKRGYVLFLNNAAIGWKLELNEPQREKPGTIAINKRGKQWVAAGGNNYDGAKMWKEVK